MTTGGGRAKVLCVDADPGVADPLALSLSRHYRVDTAPSGAAALQHLASAGPVAAIVSAMALPDMTGIALIRAVCERFPDTAKVLIVEQMDLDGAMAAVNDGQVFAILHKSASTAEIGAAVERGVVRYERVNAERALLERTLNGGIKALSDTLALANPAAHARAIRVRDVALEIARRSNLGANELWAIGVAATLSPLGIVALSAEMTDRWYRGERLPADELAAAEHVPTASATLIQDVPRLDLVREIMLYQMRGFDGSGKPYHGPRGTGIPIGSRVLRISNDYEAMVVVEGSEHNAFARIRARSARYDPKLLQVLETIVGSPGSTPRLRWVELRDLKVGMVIEKDVRSPGGALLIAHGFKVTHELITHIEAFAPALQRISVCVSLH